MSTFFKIVIWVEHNLLLVRVAEKFVEVCTQTLKNIHKCGNGWGCEIPLQLGDEALGELCTVGQFLLSQGFCDPQFP